MMTFTRSLLVLSLILTSCVSKNSQGRYQDVRFADIFPTAEIGAEITANTEATTRAPYRVSPGDSLRIEHRFNEELNRSVLVRPDGFVTLPLIEDVNVADRTLLEARKLLEGQYAKTVKNPKISIALENAANIKICVGGEVVNPGMFVMVDGLTALRAIALAGGPRPSAKMSSVVILRDQGLPKPEYLVVDLGKVTKKDGGEEDLRLHPKDMVFVPRTTIANMDKFVDQYLNQLIPFSKSLSVTYLIGKGIY